MACTATGAFSGDDSVGSRAAGCSGMALISQHLAAADAAHAHAEQLRTELAQRRPELEQIAARLRELCS